MNGAGASLRGRLVPKVQEDTVGYGKRKRDKVGDAHPVLIGQEYHRRTRPPDDPVSLQIR